MRTPLKVGGVLYGVLYGVRLLSSHTPEHTMLYIHMYTCTLVEVFCVAGIPFQVEGWAIDTVSNICLYLLPPSPFIHSSFSFILPPSSFLLPPSSFRLSSFSVEGWSDSSGASGGGFSEQWAMPSYQVNNLLTRLYKQPINTPR